MQTINSISSQATEDSETIGAIDNQRLVYFIEKRILDIVISAILLICLAPLMLLIALLIYLYSPGPVFYFQPRVGSRREKNGNEYYWKKYIFNCIKFRTMRINADTGIHRAYIQALIENDEEKMSALQNQSTQAHKLVNDTRIIKPGFFLRKFSLDELPQFFNVLIGDMSLVGPRPAIPYEVEMYRSWHLNRLLSQPGITGLQQITARSSLDFDQQVQIDLDYIKRQSILLDILIIVKTPFAILSAKGAY